MNARRGDGRETYHCLLEWDKGHAAAERLAVQLLHASGFRSIDPSHPLGGPDGLKDAICTRDHLRWVAAAYFPKGQQTFSSVKSKFLADLKGTVSNDAAGFAFVTNQELGLSERENLRVAAVGYEVDLLHLEMIGSILNTPSYYGVRLEFLELDMEREEQLAFIAARDSKLHSLRTTVESLRDDIQRLISKSEASETSGKISVPLAELQEFKSVLDKITESEMDAIYSGSYLASSFLRRRSGNINNLRVPLQELREFAQLLDRITGHPGYMASASLAVTLGKIPGHVDRLQIPLSELKEYEGLLDRIIEKHRQAAHGSNAVPTLPILPKP